jgi:hypothetical protein
MPENKKRGFCEYKHGMSNTRFYKIWSGILKRCLNENSQAFKNYGGRGITVCKEWKEDFLNFKEDMYPSYLEHVQKHGERNTSIERIDVNGNYEKSNCAWATRTTQNNNNRRVKKHLYNGMLLTLAEICRDEKVDYTLVYNRVRGGWELEKALKTPKIATGKYERNDYHRELARKAMEENTRNNKR